MGYRFWVLLLLSANIALSLFILWPSLDYGWVSSDPPKAEPAAPAALPTGIDDKTLAMLQAGGNVIFVRHSARDKIPNIQAFDRTALKRGETFPSGFTKGVCLNDVGRAESAVFAEFLQLANIPIGTVYSSPICRAVETAELSTGRVDVTDPRLVYSKVAANEAENKVRVAYLEEILSTAPDEGNAFIFGHNSILNFLDRAGFDQIDLATTGLAVFRPKGDDYELVTVATLLDLMRQIPIDALATQ